MRIRCVATATALCVVSSLVTMTAARAELGDYSFLQTLRNLTSPPRADRPVQPAERTGPYPLLANPAGFSDGFSPGRYLTWQTVQLAPETGAVCGNGSPYKIFVNRVPGSRNTLFYFEGGGACWDFDSCSGRTPGASVRNRDGLADDYMTFNQLATPFLFRLHPTDRVKTQDWNMVYVPYCTGDTYTGDRVAVYQDPRGEAPDLVWHHNGLRNVRAAIAWVRDHLPRPPQMLATGCSAGGVATFTNYHHLRRDIAPDRGFLINDSGPIFPTPRGADPTTYPSGLLHDKIRGAWGLDQGMLSIYRAELAAFDNDNLGSLYLGLATRWPNDRMGHVHFWEDRVYSRYSYAQFYDDIRNEPDPERRAERQLARWAIDTERLRVELAGLQNTGGYFPRFRDITESHCATLADFANGDIQEQRLELTDFISSVLDGSGKVLDASETDPLADHQKPFNLFYWLINNGKDVLSRIRDFFGGVFS